MSTLTLFTLTVSKPVLAQSAEADLLRRCGGHFGLCGYIDEADWKDRRTETPVIPQIYEDVGDYNEGLAPVRESGKWGYIDRKGKFIISPQFEQAGRFDNGFAPIGLKGLVGAINRRGDIVVDPKFASLLPYTDNVFFARLPDLDSDLTLRQRLPSYKYSIGTYGEENFGLYHLKDGWLTSDDFQFEHFDASNLNRIWARKAGKFEQFGLMAIDGTWAVEPEFDSVQHLSEGRAVIGKYNSGKPRVGDNKRYGAVDQNGQIVVPLTYEHLNSWRNGFVVSYKNEKVGLVGPSGNLVGNRRFDNLKRVRADNNRLVVQDGNIWHSVLPGGVLGADHGFKFLTCSSGLSFTEFGGHTEITLPDGTQLPGRFSSPKSRVSSYFTNESDTRCDAPISVKSEGRWGFILPDGALLGEGIAYENTMMFKNGFGGFQKGGLWGGINEAGEVTHAPSFKSSMDMVSILPGRVDSSHRFDSKPESNITCGAGSQLFKSDGKWGLQDKAGRILVKANHDLLTCYSGGTAFTPDHDKKMWCPVGIDGLRRKNLDCQPIFYASGPSHTSPEILDDDPWVSNLKWMHQYFDYGIGEADSPPKFIAWNNSRN